MNYRQPSKEKDISILLNISSKSTEYLSSNKDTIESLKKKNDTLQALLIKSNDQINEENQRYKLLENNYHEEKMKLYEQLDRISQNYKIYAESHKSLKATESKLNELFLNYTNITKELCQVNMANSEMKRIIQEIYTKLNKSFNNGNILNVMINIRKYVNEQWKEMNSDNGVEKEASNEGVKYRNTRQSNMVIINSTLSNTNIENDNNNNKAETISTNVKEGVSENNLTHHLTSTPSQIKSRILVHTPKSHLVGSAINDKKNNTQSKEGPISMRIKETKNFLGEINKDNSNGNGNGNGKTIYTTPIRNNKIKSKMVKEFNHDLYQCIFKNKQ